MSFSGPGSIQEMGLGGSAKGAPLADPRTEHTIKGIDTLHSPPSPPPTACPSPTTSTYSIDMFSEEGDWAFSRCTSPVMGPMGSNHSLGWELEKLHIPPPISETEPVMTPSCTGLLDLLQFDETIMGQSASFGKMQRMKPPVPTASDLQEALWNFAGSSGDRVDSDEEDSADFRAMMYGGVDGYAAGPRITYSKLEQKLDEMKQLYKAKFGEDLDDEQEEEHADFRAMQFGGIEGYAAGPHITFSALEQKLDDVKQLYKEKFGEDLDAEDEEYDEIRAMQYGGVDGYADGPHITYSGLEQKLDDLKQLYKAKFGEDLDEEEEVHADFRTMQYGGIDGYAAGPHITYSALEQKLDDVKLLYKAKFGEDLDEEEAEHADFRTMQYGGIDGYAAGPHITYSALEQKLDDVKLLYKAKFGEDLDEEEEAEHANFRTMQYGGIDGYAAGPHITYSALEQKLDDVKLLYKAKFGEDLDEEEEEEHANFRTMQYGGVDGYAAGPHITYSVLEQKLDDVKQLYKAKFGEDLDEEEEPEHADFRTMQYGGIDGYAAGPHITFSLLVKKLDDVKLLYKEKFGEDLDSDEEDHADFRTMQYGGIDGYAAGPHINFSALEQKLDDVKQLYKAKFGEDLDEEEEHSDFRAMEYGGVEGYAAGPRTTYAALQQKLDDVKLLYKQKYGEDLEADEDEEQEHADVRVMEYGGVEGYAAGPHVTYSSLERKLDEVKRLYKEKYGEDLGEDEDDMVIVEEAAPPAPAGISAMFQRMALYFGF